MGKKHIKIIGPDGTKHKISKACAKHCGVKKKQKVTQEELNHIFSVEQLLAHGR